MIIVSTDGSCLRNPGGAIGWAWVNHQGSTDSGGAASGTNQIAELRAVLEAIVAHPGTEPLFIESDSLYAIKCSSEWITSWRTNGWRTTTGAEVKNVDIIRRIDTAIASRPGPVRFRWVRGHVGNYFNEQADTLAGAAARKVAAAPNEPEASAGAKAPKASKAFETAESTTATAPRTRLEIPAASEPAAASTRTPSLTLF